MKRILNILLVALIAVFTVTISGKAQNVVRKGTVFEQVSKQTDITKTQYTYKDKDGNIYPIYLSAKGKAFIIKTSKKTGKQYRQYLPKITEQLNGNN